MWILKIKNYIFHLGVLLNPGASYLRYSSSDSHIVQMRGLDFDTTEEDIIQVCFFFLL